jgi:hypothetical protein
MVHDAEMPLGGGWSAATMFRRLVNRPIALDTRLALASPPGAAGGALELDLEQWRLLSQAALRPSVREICARTGREPEQAIGRLADLVASGLVEII